MMHELLHSVFDRGIDPSNSHMNIARALGLTGAYTTDDECSDAVTKFLKEECYGKK